MYSQYIGLYFIAFHLIVSSSVHVTAVNSALYNDIVRTNIIKVNMVLSQHPIARLLANL